MPSWDDFQVLLAIHRERTLSGAARALGVDQSTMSRRLRALEAAAGARLFDRTPEGYFLTVAGEAVLPSVQEIEERALAVERKLVGHDARIEGSVRLATSESLAVWFLVPRLDQLRARHPGLSLELVTGNQPVNLARREAEISLRLSKPFEPNLIARRLGEAAWAVYAARKYVEQRGMPRLGRALADHDVVGMSEELAGTVGARWLRAQAGKARVVLSANSLLAQATAVQAGLGVSPLPCVFGDRASELCRIGRGLIGHHEVWLVVHPDVRASARVRAVMSYVTELVESEAALLAGKRPAPSPSRQRTPAQEGR